MKTLRLTLSLWCALLVPAQAAPPDIDGLWEWPTGDPAPVERAFDPPPMPWLAGHRGVDLALAPGEPVRSSAAGTVVYAGRLVDREVVSVRHADGIRSTYEPLSPAVEVGATVERGQLLGTVSKVDFSGWHSDGTLHWGAKYSDRQYVDPLLLVLGDPVLKPW